MSDNQLKRHVKRDASTTMNPHGIMFHHFHTEGDDARHPASQGSICAQELRALIESLGRSHILDAREWLRRAIGNTLRPTDICLTFDDALASQFDVALPVLEECRVTGFWFVYTSVLQGHFEPLEIYRHFRTMKFPTIDS